MAYEERCLRWSKERQRDVWQRAEQARQVALLRQARGGQAPLLRNRSSHALLQGLWRGVQTLRWASARRPSTEA